MASTHRATDFTRALLDPSSAFDNPDEVVLSRHLTRQQKIEILRRWEYDARELEVAEEENMAGGPEHSQLSEVHQALQALGGGRGQRRALPTKHGN